MIEQQFKNLLRLTVNAREVTYNKSTDDFSFVLNDIYFTVKFDDSSILLNATEKSRGFDVEFNVDSIEELALNVPMIVRELTAVSFLFTPSKYSNN